MSGVHRFGAALLGLTLAAAAAPRGDLGPFRFGMSFEEARAAAPGCAWSEVFSTRTYRPIGVNGGGALQLRGHVFDVTLTPLAYAGYRIEAQLSRTESPVGAAGCQDAVTALASDLEARFGPLGSVSATPLAPDVVAALPLGLEIAAAQRPTRVISAGRASRLDAFEPQGVRNVMWLGSRRAGDVSVVVGGRYVDVSNPILPQTCVAFARVASLPPRPPFEWLDLAQMRPQPRLSPAERHHSFDGMATLPARPVSVDLTCDVDRAAGRLLRCKLDDNVPAELARPAASQADGLRLDVAQLDPDRDIPLRTRVQLLLDAADRRPETPPSGTKLLTRDQVAWARQPRPEEMSRYYPDRAQRMNVAARVTMACEIEADGSLVCPRTRVGLTGDDTYGFERFGRIAERIYQAAQSLADGTPSAGHWVTLSFNFSLPAG